MACLPDETCCQLPGDDSGVIDEFLLANSAGRTGGNRLNLKSLLYQFTADATGRLVCAGPAEAAAIGNLLVQAMALGSLSSLEELREVVRRSFNLTFYKPNHTPDLDNAYQRFKELKQLI